MEELHTVILNRFKLFSNFFMILKMNVFQINCICFAYIIRRIIIQTSHILQVGSCLTIRPKNFVIMTSHMTTTGFLYPKDACSLFVPLLYAQVFHALIIPKSNFKTCILTYVLNLIVPLLLLYYTLLLYYIYWVAITFL